MYDEILDDVIRAAGFWRMRSRTGVAAPAPWDPPLDGVGQFTDAVARALRIVESASHGGWDEEPDRALPTGRLLMVTKNPQADSAQCLAAIIARCLAFGLEVHGVRRTSADDAEKLAAVLYGTAWLHYQRGPLSESAWAAIERRFACPEFREIFGTPFHRDLVVPVAQAVHEFGVSTDNLLEIWNEGRTPLATDEVVHRYGAHVAERLCGSRPALSWFHTAAPIGIQQISPGLVVFAMRHPMLDSGKPVLLVNGHCLALADRFRTDDGRGSFLLEVGTRQDGPTVDLVRNRLVGNDNRPLQCEEGSIRRDGADGILPLAAGSPAVSPWANVLHCSDGYLAGLVETCGVLSRPPNGLLLSELARRGFSAEEITTLFLPDPVVAVDGTELRLTERTRGRSVEECAAVIAEYFPPVFGCGNGFGGGVTATAFLSSFLSLRSVGGDTAAFNAVDEPREPWNPDRTESWPIRPSDERGGIDALMGGAVGLLIPAGGTGGRFGGYDIPEGEAKRHKSLAPVFVLQGHQVSALDIRMANARFWSRGEGARGVRCALMTSTATDGHVRDWLPRGGEGLDADVFRQPAVYRFRAESLAGTVASDAPASLEDFILRASDGQPSLKAAGTFGLLSAFALSGLAQSWRQAGVEFALIANAEDVCSRIDPVVLGLMRRSPNVDAVMLAVPAGYRAWISVNGIRVDVRGDTTGWAVDSHGAAVDPADIPPDHIEWEVGGYVGQTNVEDRWRTVVFDSASVGSQPYPYFNTNQIYLRMSSLAKIFRLDEGESALRSAVGAVRTQLPIYAERKTVTLDDLSSLQAVQLFQPVAEVLRLLPNVLVLPTSRAMVQSRRGAYLALKTKEDIPFLQQYLDAAHDCDETILPSDTRS